MSGPLKACNLSMYRMSRCHNFGLRIWIQTNGSYSSFGQLFVPQLVIRELHQETMADFSLLFHHLIFLQLFGIFLDQSLQTSLTLIASQQMIK